MANHALFRCSPEQLFEMLVDRRTATALRLRSGEVQWDPPKQLTVIHRRRLVGDSRWVLTVDRGAMGCLVHIRELPTKGLLLRAPHTLSSIVLHLSNARRLSQLEQQSARRYSYDPRIQRAA